MVRAVESNVETKASPPGDDRTSDDHRRWIQPGEETFRHGHWAARRRKILAGMEAAGYPKSRVERFVNCGAWSQVVQDVDTGETWIRGSCCHDRFCSPCTKSRALQIADNLAARIEDDRSDYLHVVLTLRHRDEELSSQVDRLYRSFRKLRTRPLFRKCVDGGAAFLQIHVAASDGLWHVHMHILARSSWLDARALSQVWHQVTGDSTNVDVSKVANAKKAVKEVCRYAASPVDKDTTNDPDKLAELMRALTGRRLCYTFGSWRRYKLTARPPADPERRVEVVGRLVDIIARANTGDEDARGILEILFRRAHPAHAPPDLYSDPWRSQ